jgi:hypothetical protein
MHPHLHIDIDITIGMLTHRPSQHRHRLTQSTILMPHNFGAVAEQVTLSMDDPTSTHGDYALVSRCEEQDIAKYS